ncbi:MAG: hypothetical protein FJZ01_11350 [Candidatus Sericytochromatia bacterium]|nr:hypothetical protein [Candidatus Tanganyikabacteria bacterium]
MPLTAWGRPRVGGWAAAGLGGLALALGCNVADTTAARSIRATVAPAGAATAVPAPGATSQADPSSGAIESSGGTPTPAPSASGSQGAGHDGHHGGASPTPAATRTPIPTPTPTEPPLQSRTYAIEVPNLPAGGLVTLYAPPAFGPAHADYPSTFQFQVAVTTDTGIVAAATWKVQPADVATVSTTHKLIALKAGTATVTGTTLDGAYSKAISLTVKAEGGIDAEVE